MYRVRKCYHKLPHVCNSWIGVIYLGGPRKAMSSRPDFRGEVPLRRRPALTSQQQKQKMGVDIECETPRDGQIREELLSVGKCS